MRQYTAILFIVSISFLAGCGDSTPSHTYSPGFTYGTASLPYVEDFIVPEPIYENEPFEVILKLSAQRNSEMLRGLVPQSLWGYSNAPYPPTATGMVLGAWCDEDRYGDETITELHWAMNPRADFYGWPPGWPAGTYKVQVISAESREWGGVTDRVQDTPTTEMPYSEHQVTREYTITVLPKEEPAG